MPSTHEMTQLLQKWSDGDEQALEELTPLVYKELRQIARHYMRQERTGHTLQTTALINEAYVRLIDWKDVQWQNRAHFFSVSAKLMRRILVDFAKSRNTVKRGEGIPAVVLDEVSVASLGRSRELVAIDEALKSLAAIDSRKSQIVELRFFGGLSVNETATVLKVSPRTVLRDWDLAKAWIYREISA